MNRPLPRTLSAAELELRAREGTEAFVRERFANERSTSTAYHRFFEQARHAAERALSETNDLLGLRESGKPLLEEGLLYVLRAMDRPTVSEDDFKSLSDAGTTSRTRFKDGALAGSALEYLSRNLNMDVLPWIEDGRSPRGDERKAACIAVAALIADQRTKTALRGNSSHSQEEDVRRALVERCGMESIANHDFDIAKDGPLPGQVFAGETRVAGSKADVVLGLYDGRLMCLECKVSNSEVNSYKRLNHETLDKVTKWRVAFGRQCVSGAVLQGCYKTKNLIDAQEAGAFLFWSSHLEELEEFVNSTK